MTDPMFSGLYYLSKSFTSRFNLKISYDLKNCSKKCFETILGSNYGGGGLLGNALGLNGGSPGLGTGGLGGGLGANLVGSALSSGLGNIGGGGGLGGLLGKKRRK